MTRGAAEVDKREVELACVFVHAGAAADDLLELRHRPHGSVEHDQPAGLDVNARGQQARRRDEDGVLRFRIDEVAEFSLAHGIAAGDPHDVA